MDLSENREDKSSGNAIGVKLKLRTSSAALALLVVCLSAYTLLRADPGAVHNFGVKDPLHHRQLQKGTYDSNFTVCGRALGSTHNALTPELREKYSTCPAFDPEKPILVLDKHQTYGRTGNQLHAILNAIQYARDHNIQLGITHTSWVMNTLTSMWFFNPDIDWVHELERSLCIKVFYDTDWKSWNTITIEDPKHLSRSLYFYESYLSQDERMATYLWFLEELFLHYNTGDGIKPYGRQDMCSGLMSVFSKDERIMASAIYSVIHVRHLETIGKLFLASVSEQTGCDPEAALEMEPDYIKSILEPLGMLDHPIVIITDGQNKEAVRRLLHDPDIGPMIHVVGNKQNWIGGDVTLAVMATVFIGNPASTMTEFIARSRVALGFGGSNYLYRAKDENGEWTDVCGDECVFRKWKGEIYYYKGWPQSRNHLAKDHFPNLSPALKRDLKRERDQKRDKKRYQTHFVAL
jgi:hypothetical protein